MGGILSGISSRMGFKKSNKRRQTHQHVLQPRRNSINSRNSSRTSSYRREDLEIAQAQPLQQAGPTIAQTQRLQQAGPTIAQAQQRQQAGPTIEQPLQSSTAQPKPRSLMNKILGREINTNKHQLNNKKKNDIFSILQKYTTFVLQRHATSCANIINKGFKTGSTSNITFGKSRLVAEIAPDSMLSSIGIDECNQVHDYLTNLGTQITKLDGFDYIFCCSELFRTQQTMFLSYFELIHNNNIKIMILPWLNEEHANDTFGEVNKDNLTITLADTKLRWGNFILKTFQGNEAIISKYSDWKNVFYLPDFIYRNPKGPEATFDKRVDLEKLYKIKMEESKIGLTRTKQSYNADDLLFALPFILYLNKPDIINSKQLKIFMTGHNGSMKKLINLITLRSASIDSRSMIKKGVNKMKGVIKTNIGEKSPYYSKPCFEKQQMMNAEIIQLESVELRRIFGGKDNIKKMDILTNNEINQYLGVPTSEIKEDFNSCRKFPVGFSQEVISKEMLIKKYLKSNELVFKDIHPFYFFYNSNLGIVYSLVDIVNQKIETSNHILYKEDYPLRVFFGMTLLQYIGYLMVAKAVLFEMKKQFKVNPKYDYKGLLDNISVLEENIDIYVGDTQNVSSKQNFKNLQLSNPVRNASQSSQNAQNSNYNKKLKLESLITTITQKGFNKNNQILNRIAFKSKSNSFTIKKIIDNYLDANNIDSINIDNIDNIISGMLKNAEVHSKSNDDENDIKTYTKYWFCYKLLQKFDSRPKQKAGQNTSSIAIKYMKKNATEYFDKKAKQFPKYSTTIKEYLFENLPALRSIMDRQEKRTKFVELLHTSLLSTCNIKPEQKNKITTFMKNSFPTGLLEPESKTPTRGFNEQGQRMLERVQKLNERTGNNINKLKAEYGNFLDEPLIPVPFIPLGKDGNNQLDKIIEHIKNMGGFYTSQDKTKDVNFKQINLDVRRSNIPKILKFIYPSINDSVIEYIISCIYKINITLVNFNMFFSQVNLYVYNLAILLYSNYGIQYILDNYKNMAIIFSIIENIGINIGPLLLETESKNNYSLITFRGLFFTLEFLDLKLYKKSNQIYTNEEIIKNIKRCYYYTIYENTEYYKKYGLCFFYFSLYIPDLIYFMSDNMEFSIDVGSQNFGKLKINNLRNHYKKKVEYLFNLSDIEIREKGINAIDKFMPKFRDKIIEYKSKSEKYHILSKSRKLDTNKLYANFIKEKEFKPYEENNPNVVKNEYYNTTQENSNNKGNQIAKFKINFEKVIKLITETGINFESNEKAIATIS